MPVLVVIPARLGSTRLPHKPLQPLGGVPLVVRVAQRITSHGVADRLVVATDAEAILGVARSAGFEAYLTSAEHPSGTDRVNEIAARPEFAGYDEILNAQGDAPFLSAEAVRGSLAQIRRGFDLGTAAIPLDPDDAENPAVVKVTLDRRGRALAFSRWTAQPAGAWKHLGLYAYTRPALRRLAASSPTRQEQAERLEQLRALALGLSIGVERLQEPALPSIDTPQDLRAAEMQWTVTHEVTR